MKILANLCFCRKVFGLEPSGTSLQLEIVGVLVVVWEVSWNNIALQVLCNTLFCEIPPQGIVEAL